MKKETLLASLGCDPQTHHGIVNPPVYRASTILFDSYDEFIAADNGKCTTPVYGRYGTPTTTVLEETLAKLDGADHAIVTSSGLAAITIVLLSQVETGEHVLIPDNVYGATRRFCDMELVRMGVQVEYYDPLVGAGIDALLKDNTKLVFTESPGSLTFEVQDIPAIAKAAHAKGVLVASDSTWATPLYFDAYAHGVDINIHSATKYIGGHSDMVMGVITCKEKNFKKILLTSKNFGMTPGGDNCFLALRGIRSLAARLHMHQQNAIKVATWLKDQPEVLEVLYPALEGAPGHDIWKRDFIGASSLFGVVVNSEDDRKIAALCDGLHHFGMGYSWGGYESLCVPVQIHKCRTATKWNYPGRLLRLHIGLEHADDLIEDLAAGLKRLK